VPHNQLLKIRIVGKRYAEVSPQPRNNGTIAEQKPTTNAAAGELPAH
jgi:hypothetical protein